MCGLEFGGLLCGYNLSIFAKVGDCGIAPEHFERIELALSFFEDVGDAVKIVEQNPFLVCFSFAVPRVLSRIFGDDVFDRIGDGIYLSIGGARADDEEIGH